MTDSRPLLYTVQDHTATLTLNRPDARNALNAELTAALVAALRRADADQQVRVLVLTGAGRAFCAGGDLGGLHGDGSLLDAHDARRQYAGLFELMTHLSKLVIAAINGHAIGGGLGLVCLCDVAIMAEGARLGTPKLEIGILPVMLTSILLRSLPPKIAHEMMFTGRQISARRAYEVGLVNAVAAPEELESTVKQWAAELASTSPAAMRLAREALRVQDGMTLAQSLSYLGAMFTLNLATDDSREGIQAFLEKRPPEWRGR